jgi:Rrf2 family protein
MLSLSRKVDYALIALAYLVDHPGEVVSASRVARECSLPEPLLRQILKQLHRHDVLESTRGTRGGYRIRQNLDKFSLLELVEVVECRPTPNGHCTCCEDETDTDPSAGPLQALHLGLRRYLSKLSVADLVIPGRRIDVPAERLVSRRRVNPMEPFAFQGA